MGTLKNYCHLTVITVNGGQFIMGSRYCCLSDMILSLVSSTLHGCLRKIIIPSICVCAYICSPYYQIFYTIYHLLCNQSKRRIHYYKFLSLSLSLHLSWWKILKSKEQILPITYNYNVHSTNVQKSNFIHLVAAIPLKDVMLLSWRTSIRYLKSGFTIILVFLQITNYCNYLWVLSFWKNV